MAQPSYRPGENLSLDLNELYQFPVQDSAIQLAVQSPVGIVPSSSTTSLQSQASLPPSFPSVQIGGLTLKRIKTRPEKNITVSLSLVGPHIDFSCVQFSQKHLNRRRLWADDRMRLNKQASCIVMSVYVTTYSFASTSDGWERACKRARGEEPIPSRDATTPVAQLDDTDPAHPRNGGQILPCERCIDRERKEVSRTKKKKPPDKQMLEYDTERILVINAAEYTDVTTNLDGSKWLTFNMRVTCCCGHQGEKGEGGYVAFFTFRTTDGLLLSQYVSALLQVSSSTDQDNSLGSSKKAMIHADAQRGTDQDAAAGGLEKPKIAFEAQRIYPSGPSIDPESSWRPSNTSKSFRPRPSTLPPTPLTNDFSLPQTPIAAYSVPPTPVREWFVTQDNPMGQFHHAGMEGTTAQFDDAFKGSTGELFYPGTMPVFATPVIGDALAAPGVPMSSMCGPMGNALPLAQGLQPFTDENLCRQGLWGIQSSEGRTAATSALFSVQEYDDAGLCGQDRQASDGQTTATADLTGGDTPQWAQAFAENKYPQCLQHMQLDNPGPAVTLESLPSDDSQTIRNMHPAELQTLQTSPQSVLQSLADGAQVPALAFGTDTHGCSRSRPSHEQLPRIQTRGLPYPNINLLNQRREKRSSHPHKTPGVQLQAGVAVQPNGGQLTLANDSFDPNPTISQTVFDSSATPQPNELTMSGTETSHQSNSIVWADARLTPQGLPSGNTMQAFAQSNIHSQAEDTALLDASTGLSHFNGAFTANALLSPPSSQPVPEDPQLRDATTSHQLSQTVPEGPWLAALPTGPAQHNTAFSSSMVFAPQAAESTNQWQTYGTQNGTPASMVPYGEYGSDEIPDSDAVVREGWIFRQRNADRYVEELYAKRVFADVSIFGGEIILGCWKGEFSSASDVLARYDGLVSDFDM
ncbi:uncharacterized protein EI97DRAFT_455249 [Westerdykella ornata]|uniref:SPT23/MGA2-like DNA-binding domain-containing protein n=1 Tax=Westerdykella ornata TaxID=318751 RepID=A0A6A6JUP8_WESOR|nr:uncharacterized protein EI97DRAFT_455249 [Westerdykella ornata]KAF2280351.1 hypothetical protein EI97DRAFT_455249 [Westerdykella ornata]